MMYITCGVDPSQTHAVPGNLYAYPQPWGTSILLGWQRSDPRAILNLRVAITRCTQSRVSPHYVL